jgi:hypothetical protein
MTPPALRIATTAINPELTSPAGPVWLPLRTAHVGGQVALSALDAALDYGAEQERALEQTAQPQGRMTSATSTKRTRPSP